MIKRGQLFDPLMPHPRTPVLRATVFKMSTTLREARPSDLIAITDIAYSAFLGSPLYNHFSPYHADHPATFRRFLRNELRTRMVSPGQVIIVAEMPRKEDQNGLSMDGIVRPEGLEIVGYSVWVLRKEVVPVHWNTDSLVKSMFRPDFRKRFLTRYRILSQLVMLRRNFCVNLFARSDNSL